MEISNRIKELFGRHPDLIESDEPDVPSVALISDPQHPHLWRASAAILLIGETGARISAALQLKWSDVEIDGAGGTITWPRETNKTRREFVQPLTEGALAALLTAKYWRSVRGITSPYVFPTGRPSKRGESHLTKSALLSALARAEARAGITHLPLRGAHGLRRMVATTIATDTGNVVFAMQWIGDEDVRQARSYVKPRQSILEATAQRLSFLGSGMPSAEASPKKRSTRGASPPAKPIKSLRR